MDSRQYGSVSVKEIREFLSIKINSLIAVIARLSGDSLLVENEMARYLAGQSHSAERTLVFSNLRPLNKLETNRLENIVSPHKIQLPENETQTDGFLRDLAAINEFLHYVEAEPYIAPEKAENLKRVAFKKAKAANVPST